MGNYMFKNTHGTGLNNRHKKQKRTKKEKAQELEPKYKAEANRVIGTLQGGKAYTFDKNGEAKEVNWTKEQYEEARKSPIVFFEMMQKAGYEFPHETEAFVDRLEQEEAKREREQERMEYNEHGIDVLEYSIVFAKDIGDKQVNA